MLLVLFPKAVLGALHTQSSVKKAIYSPVGAIFPAGALVTWLSSAERIQKNVK